MCETLSNVKLTFLLEVDNIFRFVQAGAEVSGLLGELPSRVDYQPTKGVTGVYN